MRNGSITINWNERDTLDNWRGTLHLQIANRNMDFSSDNDGRNWSKVRKGTISLFFRLKNSHVSGPVQMFGLLDNEVCDLDCIESGLGYVGHYQNGKPVGHAWKGLKGGGWLHGRVDPKDGTFTGDSIAYIYRDLETALVGKFVDSTMV